MGSPTYRVRKLDDTHPEGWFGAFYVHSDGTTLDRPSCTGVYADVLVWIRNNAGTALLDQGEPASTVPDDGPVKADGYVGTCDSCSAAAVVEMANGADVLTFCLHHHRNNADALTASGYTILRDARHLLTL